MTADPSRRRRLLGCLGAVAGIGAIAGCTGGGDDSSASDAAGGGPGSSTGTTTVSGGSGASVDGTTGDGNPEQRAIELRAILREFEGGYEQDVLDRADAVRRERRDSVVFVDLEPEPVPHRLATGWFVAENLVVTTKQKLRGLDSVSIHTAEGDLYHAEIVWRHPGIENVAVLEVPIAGEPVTPAEYATVQPEPNEPLVQIGHHDEYGHWVATLGDYIRTDTFDANPSYIDEHVSNTPGLPGSTGSPVFNLDGHLVGTTNGAEAREPRGSEPPAPLGDYVYDWQMSHREWFHHLDAEQTYDELPSDL